MRDVDTLQGQSNISNGHALLLVKGLPLHPIQARDHKRYIFKNLALFTPSLSLII